MSGKLTRDAYGRLIAEDLKWLRAQPRTIERDHIAAIVEASVAHEYDLRAEVERLRAEVPYLKHLHVEGGAMDVTIEGAKRVVGLLATSLAKMFADAGATNYVQYEVRNAEHDYILLLQRAEGKTPHQLRQEAERERDEARADRDVYRRVLEAIGAFLKTGAVDPFAEQKSTVFLAVRELRDERDEARTELATLRAQAETAADALLDVGAEMLRLQGRAAKLGEALAIERNHACHCDFLADGSECASCERIDAALEETPRG